MGGMKKIFSLEFFGVTIGGVRRVLLLRNLEIIKLLIAGTYFGELFGRLV